MRDAETTLAIIRTGDRPLESRVLVKPSDNRAAAPAEVAALTVRIVPTDFDETGRVIEMNRPSQHFYVVATNVSGQSIRLWREWCSWGYYNLTFQVTGREGGPVE